MNDKEKNPMDHEYDGIREYDNPIPPWFQAMFLGTVICGVLYFFYFSLGSGASQNAEYEKLRAQDELAQREHALRTPVPTLGDPELNALLGNPERIQSGKAAFETKCASCHGNIAQGGIGPNLTDEYWIHGGKLSEIQRTIIYGAVEKGMPPWGPSLSRAEIESLTVYIRSLLGTKPAGAKPPQGERFRAEGV